MKFGGAVLRDHIGFEQMATIINSRKNEKILLIISAFASSTRTLETAAFTAREGKQDFALGMCDAVIAEHKRFAAELLKDNNTNAALYMLLDEAALEIHRLLKGISITRELSARTLDALLSYGEYFALHVVKHFLQENGLHPVICDSREIIITDANHGRAMPYHEKTAEKVNQQLKPIFQEHSLVLMQGFVASAENGQITTMGKESSNLTASLLGSLLQASEINVWTDTDGIRSADPSRVNGTICIPALSYQQARELSLLGVKLLYPTMLDDPEKSNIPVYIRNAARPEGEYTVISLKAPSIQPDLLICVPAQTIDHRYAVPDREYLKAFSVLIVYSSKRALFAHFARLASGILQHPETAFSAGLQNDIALLWGPPPLLREILHELHQELLQLQS
jgi:aspartate kinase